MSSGVRASLRCLVAAAVLTLAVGACDVGESPGPSGATTGCTVTVTATGVGAESQLVGTGFPPDEPAKIVIEDATGVTELTQTTNPALRTDVRGRVLFTLHPRREHIGPAQIRLSAGACTAETTHDVLESWFPPACDFTEPVASGGDAATAYERLIRADRPVAYWRFEEEGGPLAAGTTGTDAAYVGDVAFSQRGPIAGSRAIGLAGGFPKVDLVDIALQADFTIEGWMYFCDDDIDASDGLFGPTPNLNFHEAIPRLWDGEMDRVVADRPVEHVRWYHVALARTGSQLSLYLDGVPVGEGTFDGALSVGTLGDADIGTLTGLLDEVAIYDHALTQEQLAARVAAAAS